jgi:hypothetical protein
LYLEADDISGGYPYGFSGCGSFNGEASRGILAQSHIQYIVVANTCILIMVKGKVKLSLYQAMEAHRVVRR